MARQMKDSEIEWIGEIPEDWTIVPLQYHADLNTESLGEDTAPDYEFDYVEIGSVTLEGGINEYEHVQFANAPSRARRIVKENDIIVSTVRTYLKAIAIVPARENVIVSTGFAVLTPKNVDVDFLGFFLKSEYFVNMVTANSVGISYPAINASDLVKFKILLPSIEEQHRIAAFLDRKCAEIDAVIERTKATIDEYKKLKQAVITEAVTKGVRGPRPMQDSGVEMIGTIPSDWTCTRVSRIATVVRGGSPRPAGDSRFFNGNYIPWITVAEVTNTVGHYITSTETCLTEEGAKCSRIVDAGTLLLSNSGATLGVPKITNIRGCINDGSVAFYNLEIDKMYLLYVFASYTEELRKQRQGYGQPNLNTDIIKGLYIPQPPTYEQNEIVAYLDEKCAALDTLIAKKTALLTELETYKKSLIYEHVTGKKEVV